MKTLTVKMGRWGFGRGRGYKTRTITVRLRPATHWRTSDPSMKAYDVIALNNRVLGKITREIENTDRHYGRIRMPGKGRLAWGWRRTNGHGNSPGLYARNIPHAIAKMMGFDTGEEI
jgi:hypothetical protein